MHAILFFASLASANYALNLMDTFVEGGNNHNLQARQPQFGGSIPTSLADESCTSAILDIEEKQPMPTIPVELQSYMNEDLCINGLPKSLSAMSSSFTKEWASWTSAVSDEAETARRECPSITMAIDMALNMCAETEIIDEYHESLEDAAPRESVMLMGAALAATGAVAMVVL